MSSNYNSIVCLFIVVSYMRNVGCLSLVKNNGEDGRVPIFTHFDDDPIKSNAFDVEQSESSQAVGYEFKDFSYQLMDSINSRNTKKTSQQFKIVKLGNVRSDTKSKSSARPPISPTIQANVFSGQNEKLYVHNSDSRSTETMDQNLDVPSRKLPSAIIIGVKKGGTRALLEFLRQHPDVRAPGPEIHFFDRHYDLGLEWYRNRMPHSLPGQVTMEKTPSYFVGKGVPERIYNMSQDIKIVLVVRDPVTRAISDYTQSVSKRTAKKPFKKLAFLRNSSIVDTRWPAIRIGLYANHLERWLEIFPRQQIHIISGEKLITEPAKLMAGLQEFLGLQRVISEKHFYFNATKGFPCLKKKGRKGRPHCLGNTKGRKHPNIEKTVLDHLREFFRPFNRRFYKLCGVDFGWL